MKCLRPVVVIFAILALTGCAAQVTSNAVDMNASYRGLLTRQILYNLGQARDEPALFFPSQVVVNGGGTDSVGTITPSLTLPLPATTLANAVAAGAATTVTNTSTTALGNMGFGLSAANQTKFTWSLETKNDPDEMRRLRALYLYATGTIPTSCRDDLGRALSGADACFKQLYVMQGSPRNVNQIFTDRPSCVLCGSAADQNDLVINDRLGYDFVRTSPENGFQFLAAHDGKQFYVSTKKGGSELFVEFMLFVLEAISTSDLFEPYKPLPRPVAAGAPRVAPLPPVAPFAVPQRAAPNKIQSRPPIFVRPL